MLFKKCCYFFPLLICYLDFRIYVKVHNAFGTLYWVSLLVEFMIDDLEQGTEYKLLFSNMYLGLMCEHILEKG